MQKLKDIALVVLLIYALGTTTYIIYNSAENKNLAEIVTMMKAAEERRLEEERRTQEVRKIRPAPEYGDYKLGDFLGGSSNSTGKTSKDSK